jgi:hypothetical protein
VDATYTATCNIQPRPHIQRRDSTIRHTNGQYQNTYPHYVHAILYKHRETVRRPTRCNEVMSHRSPSSNNNKRDSKTIMHSGFGKHIHANAKMRVNNSSPTVRIYYKEKKETHTHHMMLTSPFLQQGQSYKIRLPTTHCGHKRVAKQQG